jgi:hypothetical protein
MESGKIGAHRVESLISKIAVKSLGAAMILIIFAFTSTAQSPPDITADPNLETANKVKDYYADWLSSIPGVSAVTVRDSDAGLPEIRVEVEQMTAQIKGIPDKLNGIPVVVVPFKHAEGGSLLSSEPLGGRGFLPTPTPEVEISPVPTPQGNKFFREESNPDALPSP